MRWRMGLMMGSSWGGVNWGVVVTVALMAVMSYNVMVAVEGKPWPAPDLRNCVDYPMEKCCIPALFNGTTRKFTYPKWLPMRTRRAAHLVDASYAAKIQKAYELMKALPDTDPRSFNNQASLHCAYCDNHFFYPEFPQSRLEIHRNWLFLPWHRLFLYYHERILAKLIGDDTFALPFWDYDNQSAQKPEGNTYPELYWATTGYGPFGNTTYLTDPTRHQCSAPPHLVDFQDPFQTCINRTADYQRFQNAHAMYTQLVATPVLPTLFHGEPYRYGDIGAVGGGTIEVKPHGSMHIFANNKKALFTNSAFDPVFYALHSNIDRLWKIWKKIPGGVRTDPDDPDWLNTEFTFYDEDGKAVTAAVHQALDTKLLRYKYEKVPAPWLRKGAVELHTKASWPRCSPHTKNAATVQALIDVTPAFKAPLNYTNFTPLTFKVERPPPRPSSDGEEVLEIQAKAVNWTRSSEWMVFLYMPESEWHTSVSCPEWLGVMGNIPHIGQSFNMTPNLTFRVGLRQKLKDLGLGRVKSFVLTLMGPLSGPPDSPNAPPNGHFLLTSAEVKYQKT